MTTSPPLYRYQLLPHWSREPLPPSSPYRGDELSALVSHLAGMKQVSYRWSAAIDAYDISIYSERAHELFMEWFYGFPEKKTGCSLVKAKIA